MCHAVLCVLLSLLFGRLKVLKQYLKKDAKKRRNICISQTLSLSQTLSSPLTVSYHLTEPQNRPFSDRANNLLLKKRNKSHNLAINSAPVTMLTHHEANRAIATTPIMLLWSSAALNANLSAFKYQTVGFITIIVIFSNSYHSTYCRFYRLSFLFMAE